MATINKIKGTDNNTYDLEVDWSNVTSKPTIPTQTSQLTNNSGFNKEAYLEWGGRNLNSTYGVIDASMVPELGSNRLAFMPANAVSIEYSRDGGTTWTDYEATDAMKINLFNGNDTSIRIGKNTEKNVTNIVNYQARVSIATGTAGVYTVLNKFCIYVSSEGSSNCWCTIRARTQNNYLNSVNTWTTFADKVPIGGWSGYNIINTSGLTTYGNTPASQYGQVQFIFGCDGYSSNITNYLGLIIIKILGFGGVGWNTPSTMAKYGRMYTYDYAKNVAFPAQVTATNFNGKATSAGTADTATALSNQGHLNTQEKLDNFSGQGKMQYATFSGLSSVGMASNDGMIVSIPWTSGNYGFQMAFDDATNALMKVRGRSNGTWGNWYKVLHEGNTTVPTESTVSGWGFTKNTGTYSKPSGGIPKTDLESAVQTSLGKADTALQSYTETDPTVPSWAKASTKPTYTASEVGLGNVGNFKAVSTVASQGLNDTEKSNARANIGAGTSSFSGNYNDLTNKPTIPSVTGKLDKDGGIATNLIMSGSYRDDYYASNVCRHFYGGTPTEFVIKTKIKFLSGTHMPLIRIYGYAYGLQSPIEIRVGFYIYNDTLGWAGASSTGAWKPEIYLYRYTENNVNYVALGLKGSCYFCGFQVDAQIGASGAFNDNFKIDGWSTTHNGTNTAVTLIPAVNTDKCIKVEYKTMKTDIDGRASTAGTADVANSVLWGNVSGRPTKVSELTNDSGFTSNAGTVTSVAVKMNNTVKGTVTSNGTIDLGTVITAHQSLDAYTPTANLADVALNGEYGSLLNLPVVPTVVSELPNDAGYLDSTSFITTGGQTIVDSGALVSYSTSWNVQSVGGATNAYTFYLEVIETSVNTDAKTSAVTYKVYAKGNNNYSYNNFSAPTVTIKVDGTSLGAVNVTSISTTKSLVATKSNTVAHNADGTKTISVTVQYANAETSYLPKPHTSSAYSVALSTFTETEGVDISGIRTPNGKVYNLADTYAREQIENIANVGYEMITDTNLVGRKWDNGFLEYWIKKAIPAGAYTAWQSHYYRTASANVTYPTPFTDALGILAQYDNPTAYASQPYPAGKTGTPNVRLMAFTNQSSLTGNLYIYAWGYWK